ncbi:NAD(P)H-dependent oxidoreductase [Bradyrhizobium japonicum]|uniref:NAD(P)H-dependent oxidoreductase n=1 Tax=Bradyrhizobium japonicum TaxID=375 RepID=UPI001BA770F9|nr:NAD(P)H-dependent oxidoreductase [Bradyrhizobium japonicum]MBR0911647.1 NAD(P)H-dependent oxidoreductase [Bradyrhizobium japonicum]
MRVHLVHAHPEPRSFVSAMRDVIANEFIDMGATVTVSDLYQMGFNPVLSARDFESRKCSDYLVYALEQRHGYETGSLSQEIRDEVANVLAADVLGFTFPIYWFSVPAILKGWIERIFLSGPMYGGKRLYDRGGLKGKRSFAAMALGGRSHMFGSAGIHGDLETGMMRHFFQGTLGYVGLAVYRPFVAYHVPYVTDHDRAEMLDGLRRYTRDLERQPQMVTPDIGAFDHTLARR